MKFLTLLIIAILFAKLATAQTNAPVPTTPAAFAQQVGSWLTSFNTNETWANTPFSAWTAANFQSGAQTSAELGASYDLWHVSTNLVFAPEAVIRNASIGGVVLSGAGGFSLAYEHYDLSLAGYVNGGYRLDLHTGQVEFGVRAKKKMTTSTFTLLSIYFDAPFKGNIQTTPSVTLGLGWTF